MYVGSETLLHNRQISLLDHTAQRLCCILKHIPFTLICFVLFTKFVAAAIILIVYCELNDTYTYAI